MMSAAEIEARLTNKPIPPKNPYKKEYPSAYYKDGEWRIKKKYKGNMREFRINP